MSLNIERDYYNQITPPEYVLCKANKERIGVLTCYSKTLEKKFNDLDNISFKTPLYLDSGERNPYYDAIDVMKYIELPGIGFYYVKSVNLESQGTEQETKTVSCDSYEGLLAQKYLEIFKINVEADEMDEETGELINEEGSIQAQFYNVDDKEHSIMHLALEKCPEWNIGHVDVELQTRMPVFDIERQDIYSFFMEEVTNSLDCFVIFDTVFMTVNVYTDDKFGIDSEIYVSYDNLLKNTNISCDITDIKTCITPKGADELTVREVNYGFDRIYNFDYYANTDFWSEQLVEDYYNWKAIQEQYGAVYEEKLKLRNQASAKLIKFETQYPDPADDYYTHKMDWYVDDKYTLEGIREHLQNYGGSASGDYDSPIGSLLNDYYAIRTARQEAGTYNAETDTVKVVRENNREKYVVYKNPETGQNEVQKITTTTSSTVTDAAYTKAVQIIGLLEERYEQCKQIAESYQNTIDEYATQLREVYDIIDIHNNLTEDELKELSPFIREDELNTDNFAVYTDWYTDEEIAEETHRLLEHAQKELAKVAMPQLSFSASLIDLYRIPEFNNRTQLLDVGSYIHISLRDDYNVKARMIGMTFDFYDSNNLTFTFSNIATKEKNVYTDIEDAINTATDVASSVSFNLGSWKEAARTSTDINKILAEGLINAQQYVTGTTDTSSMRIDPRGIFVDTDNGQHSKDSIYIGGGRILFTEDDWMTVSEAIGRVEIEGESIFGVLADAVVAGRIYGSTLKGNDIIGGVLVSNNYSSGSYGTYIDLVNGTFEFNNGNKQLLTLDSSGNLTVTGKIQATSGYIGDKNNGLTITSSGMYTGSHSSLNSTANGVYIWNDGISIGSKFKVTSDGKLNATDGTFTGAISGGTITGTQISNGNGTFFVDVAGNLTASKANITGTISSNNASLTSGTIAGWSFNSTQLSSSTGKVTISSAGNGSITFRNDKNKSTTLQMLDDESSALYVNDSLYTLHFFATDIGCSGDITCRNLNGYATSAAGAESALRLGLTNNASDDSFVYISSGINLVPFVNDHMACGGPQHKWTQVYATKGSINTSDKRNKKNIQSISDKYESMFFELKPVSFGLYGGDRTHIGYVAQDVEKAMNDNDLSDIDFAGLCHDFVKTENEDEVEIFDQYGLRYSEFIALNTHMIQKLYKRINELEQEIERMKNA